MIREHDAGVKTAEICRKYGISDATFYKYKARFGGITVSDAQRLRTLDAENARLQQLLAQLRAPLACRQWQWQPTPEAVISQMNVGSQCPPPSARCRLGNHR